MTKPYSKLSRRTQILIDSTICNEELALRMNPHAALPKAYTSWPHLIHFSLNDRVAYLRAEYAADIQSLETKYHGRDYWDDPRRPFLKAAIHALKNPPNDKRGNPIDVADLIEVLGDYHLSEKLSSLAKGLLS